MLKSNLAVLMAERGLKIADVYEQTGISKTTLMALADNKSKGVQFETIDKLCNFFDVTPDRFFVFSKYIFRYETKFESAINSNVFFIKVFSGDNKSLYSYEYSIYSDVSDEDVSMIFSGSEGYDYYFVMQSREFDSFGILYKDLPPILKKEVDMNFIKFAKTEVQKYLEGLEIDKGYANVAIIINYSDRNNRLVKGFRFKENHDKDKH